MALFFYLLFFALLYNVPLVVVMRLSRSPLVVAMCRPLLALGFGAVTSISIWRLEWYDVFRHGVPVNPSLILTYTAIVTTYSVIGWWLGGVVARTSTPLRRRT